jgi:hypothetical protein
LCATYGYSLDQVGDLTVPQIEMLLDKARSENLRRDFTTAQLTAAVLNALGGKGDGSKKADPSKMFSVTDFLPPWSKPPEMEPSDPRMKPIPGLDPITARGIVEAGPRGHYGDNGLWLEVVKNWRGIVATAEVLEKSA